MATRLKDEFPTRTKAPTAAYPDGSYKNETSPGANDGTPLDERIGDDYEGLKQGLLDKAGITPNGQPDSVTNPQQLQAIEKFIVDGDSQLVGGAIWPLSSQDSAQDGDDLTGYEFVRLQGGLYVDLELFYFVRQDGSQTPIAGAITDIVLTTTPATANIGGAPCYLLISKYWNGSVNHIPLKSFGAIDDDTYDNSTAFSAIGDYARNLVDYTQGGPLPSGVFPEIDLGATVDKYYTTGGMQIKLGIRVKGAGKWLTRVRCDGSFNLVHIIENITNGQYPPSVSGFSTEGSGVGRALFCDAEQQWHCDYYDLFIQNFDYGIHFRIKDVPTPFFSGSSGNKREDVFIYQCRIGHSIEGRPQQSCWQNSQTYTNLITNNCVSGVEFKYCIGLEGVIFETCVFNENSKSYETTPESNYVQGLVFNNARVSNVVLDGCYLEKIDPKRQATQDEINLLPGLTLVQKFDDAFNTTVNYYYDSDIIMTKLDTEPDSDLQICSRDFKYTGAIVCRDSEVNNLTVKNSAINLNEIMFNYDNVGTPFYKQVIKFVDNHAALNPRMCSQVFEALNVINSQDSSRIEFTFDNDGMYLEGDNRRVIKGNQTIGFRNIKYGDYTKKYSSSGNNTDLSEGVIYMTVDPSDGNTNAVGSEDDKILVSTLYDIINNVNSNTKVYVSGTGAIRFEGGNITLRNQRINIELASTVDIQLNRPSVPSPAVILYDSSIKIQGGRILVYKNALSPDGGVFIQPRSDNCEIFLNHLIFGNVGTENLGTEYKIVEANGDWLANLQIHKTTSTVSAPSLVRFDGGIGEFDYPQDFTYSLTNMASTFFGAP